MHGDPVRGSQQVAASSINEGRFGRLFRRLPACPTYDDATLNALAESMRDGASIPTGWNQATPPADGDNLEISAGYTYFGQFVDHDITFDAASSLQQQNDPDALVNFRSPRFDLDSVYGSGPKDEPFQYELDGLRLLITPNAQGFDELPRNRNHVAIVGDPRNDENTIVSQMQLAFLRLHNHFVDQVQEEGRLTSPGDQFAEAQRLTRWHYQWALVHDFLPRLIGRKLFDKLYDQSKQGEPPEIRLRYYKAKTSAYMPVEFSAAAYRFGHSQVRDRYAINDAIELPLFMPGDEGGGLIDFRGRQSVPPSWAVSWPFFFPLGSSPQLTRLINTKLSASLFDLPGQPAGAPQSLAFMNLRRGQTLSLPSGQAVASHMKHDVLTQEQLRGPENAPVPDPTPLWYYLLREAEVQGGGGAHLGPTGGRIVGEVLLGLLEQDPTSFYNVERGWRPAILEGKPDGAFTVGELVTRVLG